MAVRTIYTPAYPDPSTFALPDGIFASPISSHMMSTVPILAGDSATSKIFVCKIPSRARLSPASLLYHTAITGLTSLDLGFPNEASGSFGAILAAALDLSSAGAKNVMNAVATPNLPKRMWELIGLASDPGRDFDLIATMNAAATAAGTVVFNLTHFTRGG